MNRSAGLEPVSVAALALLVLAVPLACPSAAVAGDVRVMTFNIRYGTAPDGPNSWESRRHRRGSYPSDHFPVTAVLRIPARSRE